MVENDGRRVELTAGEAVSVFLVLKAREESLDRSARPALAKLEKFLYEALSIEEMELLLREVSR